MSTAVVRSRVTSTVRVRPFSSNLRAHDEGGLEIAGFQPDARYEQVYNDLKANGISEQEAVSRLGQIYGDGELHGDSRVTYRDHYTQAAQQDWEKAQNRQ